MGYAPLVVAFNDTSDPGYITNTVYPYGTASATGTYHGLGPDRAFDGNLNTIWEDESLIDNGVVWIQMDYGTGVSHTINNYSVSDNPGSAIGPTNWIFQGSNDGVSWTPLDARSGITWSAASQVQYFHVLNTNPYRYYQLNITATNYYNVIVMGEFGLYTETRSKGPTSWNWNFGDGATGTSSDMNHLYTTAGNYTISLNVTNAGGSNTMTKSNYLFVRNPVTPPIVSLTGSPTNGTAPLTVAFTSYPNSPFTSTTYPYGTASATGTYQGNGPDRAFDGNLNTYWEDESLIDNGVAWIQMDYGNGVTHIINNYSVSDNPLSTIVGPTSWTLLGSNDNVTWTPLDARSGVSWVASSQVQYFQAANVNPYRYYQLNITATNYYNVIVMGEFGLYSDQIDSVPMSWNWSFGDGSTSTIRTPTYQYATAGNYSISLSALNNVGSNSTTMTNYITVWPSGSMMEGKSSGSGVIEAVITQQAPADFTVINATRLQMMTFVDKNITTISTQ